MKKYLLQIEFRYNTINKYHETEYHIKKVTIGIYDNLKIAVNAGNKALKPLAKTFEVRDNFSEYGFFGNPKRLITNTCYPTKGVEYFASIIDLDFCPLDTTISEIFKQKAQP